MGYISKKVAAYGQFVLVLFCSQSIYLVKNMALLAQTLWREKKVV